MTFDELWDFYHDYAEYVDGIDGEAANNPDFQRNLASIAEDIDDSWEDDEIVNEVARALNLWQYGETSDADDLDEAREDLRERDMEWRIHLL